LGASKGNVGRAGSFQGKEDYFDLLSRPFGITEKQRGETTDALLLLP
jgi:hypothetical protein